MVGEGARALLPVQPQSSETHLLSSPQRAELWAFPSMAVPPLPVLITAVSLCGLASLFSLSLSHFCFLWRFPPGLAVFWACVRKCFIYMSSAESSWFLSFAIFTGLSHTSLRVLS